MADDEGYVEVDAVVRIPKGRSLADSKKTDGWSRGFTPRSSEKGPEHVEIRLKKDVDELQRDSPLQPDYGNNYSLRLQAETREQEELEEMLRAVVLLAIVKAAEVTVPLIRQWWMEQALPYFKEKRKAWRGLRARRSVLTAAVDDEPVVIDPILLEEVNEVSDALEAYEANMTSGEARQHLTELLIAQHFVNEKRRIIANARIRGRGVPQELAATVQALTPEQVRNALDSLLVSQPRILDDLAVLVRSRESDGLFQLESERMKEALRFPGEPE
ncbi:hypothetical protein [Sanguibacter sp. 25GB23B1]|uniref:hypothetical protein n=1 Tax=unclassified Sanguibacter TaxID=2645534 RepID=UPI0032AEA42A